MAEALSQSQIDELLNRMRSGESEDDEEKNKKKYKEYDFSSPKKFTKDQLKSLNNLYENYSRVLSAYFTGVLRNVCEVTVADIEEQRYFEFNNALTDNTLIGMITFRPDGEEYDEYTIMLELPTSLGFLLIDRLMGGAGPVFFPDRDYTEIEMALLNTVMKKTSSYLQESWSNFFSLRTNLRSIETNGRLLQAFSPQEIVVISTMEIKEEHYEGVINMCMPAENLEAILNNFSVKYAHTSKQQDPEKEKQKKDIILSYLKESELEITAVLDVCQMRLSDISQLQKNDVIALNQKINSDIVIDIEGIPWFTARLGEVEQMKALKVVDILGK